MHPFFAPLSDYEVMLLLTTLTVGGSEHVADYRHLPGAMRQRLQEKATALLAIPGDKRVPLMVRELKNALATNGRRGIERIDPTWIVHGLRGETPRVVATLLIDLPAPVVRSVLKRLPAALRKSLPPKDELKEIDPVVAAGVRQIFEARFHPMPTPPTNPVVFTLPDLIHLERVEIYTLIRDLGLVELGQAFVSVGKMALLDLCRRLPRDNAEELVLAVRAVSRVDVPDDRSAQRFLSRVVVNFEDTEELFQKSGLWRLAKAARLEDDMFQNAFAQRLPRKAGELFLSYVKKTDDMEELTEDVLKRLQDAIMVRLQHLAWRKVIASALLTTPIGYHDADAAARAVEEANRDPGAEAATDLAAAQKVHDDGPSGDSGP